MVLLFQIMLKKKSEGLAYRSGLKFFFQSKNNNLPLHMPG